MSEAETSLFDEATGVRDACTRVEASPNLWEKPNTDKHLHNAKQQTDRTIFSLIAVGDGSMRLEMSPVRKVLKPGGMRMSEH